jgi:hypothetical protein
VIAGGVVTAAATDVNLLPIVENTGGTAAVVTGVFCAVVFDGEIRLGVVITTTELATFDV